MAPFYGWGSTASRLEPLWGGSLLFTLSSQNSWYSFYRPRKNEGLSRPWIHSRVQNHWVSPRSTAQRLSFYSWRENSGLFEVFSLIICTLLNWIFQHNIMVIYGILSYLLALENNIKTAIADQVTFKIICSS